MVDSLWHTLYVYFLRTFLGLFGPWKWRQRMSVITYQLAWRDILEYSTSIFNQLSADSSPQPQRAPFMYETTISARFTGILHFIDKYNSCFSTKAGL